MNKLTNFNTIKVVKMPPKTLPVKTGSLQVNKEQTEADDGGIEVVGVDILCSLSLRYLLRMEETSVFKRQIIEKFASGARIRRFHF